MAGAERMKGLLSWKCEPLSSQGFGEIWHRDMLEWALSNLSLKKKLILQMFRC